MSATTAPAWPPRGAMRRGAGSPRPLTDPFWPALLVALVLHGLLILALGFQAPEPARAPSRTLEVLVLRQPEAARSPPPAAEALAQANREASGTASEIAATDRRPGERSAEPSDLPALAEEPDPLSLPVMPEADTPAPPPVPGASLAPPTEAASLTATLPEPLPTEPAPALERPAEPELQPSPQPALVPRPSAAQILASRGQEIAKLNAKIEEDTAAYASRTRRKAISASTQEYKYASYLEAWRRKVESIGNLNYPEEAKRRQLYGNLILRVALRADGTLEEVRVLRSSGSEVLDQAAVRIVNLAAPYAPFPPDIRKETDVLDITRTWQFLSNNRFGEKK
ncbi:MAG: TonB family protein [Chromatiaceae bacterium]|nr:TonB family protein [Chromatiaceae bacterium]